MGSSDPYAFLHSFTHNLHSDIPRISGERTAALLGYAIHLTETILKHFWKIRHHLFKLLDDIVGPHLTSSVGSWKLRLSAKKNL